MFLSFLIERLWNSGDSIQQMTLDAGRKEILEKKEGVSCHNRIEKPQVDNTYKIG